MYNLRQHIHFVGIGGVGMAGIAEVLLTLGYPVSGSDIKTSTLTERLLELGATISFGHAAENLPVDCSVVVYSTAVAGSKNPELEEATRRRIPTIPRAAMLAELMRMKYGIAVAGSHGKTSTTSMVAKILIDAGHDPTVIVGGRVLSQTTGAKLGAGAYMVAEADESDGSFCLLRPAIAVVTNIDVEHMNHYRSFGALEQAFGQFMLEVPFYGLVVACVDDPVVARLTEGLQRRVVRYGLNQQAEVRAADITVEHGCSHFQLILGGENVGPVTLPIPGVHMVSNSLAAVAVALELGVYVDEIRESLAHYPGVSRRTEIVAQSNGVMVLDDYAHHPTEIAATLRAVRAGWIGSGEGRLIAVFQPHRFSRTRDLFREFLTCFSEADLLFVGEIYGAGEENIEGISGAELVSAIQHRQATFVPQLQDLVSVLPETLRPGDVLITLGAGSVGSVAKAIAEKAGIARVGYGDGRTTH